MAANELSITPYQVVLPTPTLLIIVDANGNMENTPRDRKKIAIPNCELFIANDSFTVGI